jgi:molybdopterin converting factor small subunit
LSKELELQKESLTKLESELEVIKDTMNTLDKKSKEYLELKSEFDLKLNTLLIIDENIMFLSDLNK